MNQDPFRESIRTKEDLVNELKRLNERVDEFGKNAILVYYGMIHGRAIDQYYPYNQGKLLSDAGVISGSVAYFQAGIKAWRNICNGRFQLPQINRNRVRFEENSPRQIIFYGAPGTGKSKKVNDTTEQMPKENVFRVTFHPDSDYASFVGCYKPTKNADQKVVSMEELKVGFNECMDCADTKCSGLVQFGYTYAESLKWYCDIEGKTYSDLLTTDLGYSDASGTSYVNGGMYAYDKTAKDIAPITYEFVPQAFIKAYVRAMQNPDKQVMLVIEEINRGNCAQIFGDIFQLLDRNEDGVSDYAVKPDTDLEAYLKAELGDKYNENEGMRLPKNLYIWATMNTSDQSLFPIDSAFKRRWEWKYMPIKDCSEGYKIVLGNGKEYDWYEFISKMNGLIADKTDSEDKQMGYFFIKAQDGKISADRFVNKVLFYLYNDVFKSYDLPTEFGNKKFTAFFTDTDTKVAELLDDLDVKKLNEPDSAEASEDTAEE